MEADSSGVKDAALNFARWAEHVAVVGLNVPPDKDGLFQIAGTGARLCAAV